MKRKDLEQKLLSLEKRLVNSNNRQAELKLKVGSLESKLFIRDFRSKYAPDTSVEALHAKIGAFSYRFDAVFKRLHALEHQEVPQFGEEQKEGTP